MAMHLVWNAGKNGAEFASEPIFELTLLVRPAWIGDGFIGEFLDTDGEPTTINNVHGRTSDDVKDLMEKKITTQVTRSLFNL